MLERQSDQGGLSWLQQRAGHATASRFIDILAISKRDGKPLKAREDYLMELVVERLTGEPIESASSYAMQWGTDAEPYARAAYETNAGAMVREVGFAKHKVHKWVGASSDGRVGATGGIEIKCPFNSAVHLATWANGMPENHEPQVYGQMWVMDLEWIDFCSYDPRMQGDAAHLKLYKTRIMRNQKYIDQLEEDVLNFLAEVEAKVQMFLAFNPTRKPAMNEAAPDPAPQPDSAAIADAMIAEAVIPAPDTRIQIIIDPEVLEFTPEEQASLAVTLAPAEAPPTLKLGVIVDRLGFNVTAEFLASLGFAHGTAKGQPGKLYQDADFPRICAAIQRHVADVQAKF